MAWSLANLSQALDTLARKMERGQCGQKFLLFGTGESLAEAESIADVLRFLDLVPRGGNYESIRKAIAECGVDGSHLRSLVRGGRGRRWDYSVDEVAEAVRGPRASLE
jgi:hypothetical protein